MPSTTVYLYPTPTEGKYVTNFTSEQATFDEIGVFTMPATNVVIDPIYEEQAPKAFDFSAGSATIDANEFYVLHYLIYGNNNELVILSGNSTFNLDIDKDGTDDLKATVTEFTPPNIPKLKIEVLETNSITAGIYTFEGLNNTPYYPASIRFVPVFTITFNANGGTVTPASAETGADGKLASLPAPTRSDYNFNGWSTTASGDKTVTTDTVFDADTEIFAQWTKKSEGGSGGNSKNTITPTKTDGGNITISPKTAAAGKSITVTVNPDKGYELSELNVTDKNGKIIKVTKKDGKYTFTMPAGKASVTPVFVPISDNSADNNSNDNNNNGGNEPNTEKGFKDVKENDYFFAPVNWASENGVTDGTSLTTFSPYDTCTRAQLVTFLWRTSGSPVPTISSPFTDISEDVYYYNAVLWAYENGITVGTSETTFGPDENISRAQAVTFLNRISRTAAEGVNPFVDVNENDYYYNATVWAYENGIASGVSENEFAPLDDCLRGQIVTFLYRFYK